MKSHEDRIFSLLANRRNRVILSILSEAARPLTVAELAERIVTHDRTPVDTLDDEADLERMRLRLHHDIVPQLTEVCLVDHDPATQLVSSDSSLAVDVDWFEGKQIGDLLSRFSPPSTINGNRIGTIEGSADVAEYGLSLVDQAEARVFVMFSAPAERPDDEVDEILRTIQRAIERGVTISVGSNSPEVRRWVHERLPEVTVWEPQTDLLNHPSQKPTIRRLVLADRKAALLSILHSGESDRASTETAVVGRGEKNPLVVLVRELLGARLDHLDYQSDDFLDRLPFDA